RREQPTKADGSHVEALLLDGRRSGERGMPLLREDAEQAQVLSRDGALHQRGHVDAAAKQVGHDRRIAAAGNALDVELRRLEKFLHREMRDRARALMAIV